MPRSLAIRKHPARRFALGVGFTLVEMLLVLAIAAILGAIALPAYTSHIAKARRAQARTQLVLAAQFMQRFYASNDSFEQDRGDNGVLQQIPASLKQSPPDGTAAYVLEIPRATLTTSAYALRMVPKADGAMARDKCGALTLTSTGLRGVLVQGTAGDTALRDNCWQ